MKRFGATAGSARGCIPCGRCPPRRCKRDETARGWRAAGMSPPAPGKGAAGRKKPLRLKHCAAPAAGVRANAAGPLSRPRKEFCRGRREVPAGGE